MKLIITGFSNSGKTTVFNALTAQDLETTTYPTSISAEVEPHPGIVKIPDVRIDKLSLIYEPKKTTYATVEYIDYLGITSAAAGGDVSQNTKVFNLIKDADAVVHVVRAFEHEAILHPLGDVNPVRDVRSFEAELILGDQPLEGLFNKLVARSDVVEDAVAEDEIAGIYPQSGRVNGSDTVDDVRIILNID